MLELVRKALTSGQSLNRCDSWYYINYLFNEILINWDSPVCCLEVNWSWQIKESKIDLGYDDCHQNEKWYPTVMETN